MERNNQNKKKKITWNSISKGMEILCKVTWEGVVSFGLDTNFGTSLCCMGGVPPFVLLEKPEMDSQK